MTNLLWRKCATFQPCDKGDRCALRNMPESQVKQHFYPSDVGDQCRHYTPLMPYFVPYGEVQDSEEND